MKYLKSYNESVSDFLKPMNIKKLSSNWTPRMKFLNGVYHNVDWLIEEATDEMKPFEDVKVGDLLTMASKQNQNNFPLYPIKEKWTFNNLDEFKDYLSNHPSIIVDSNDLKIIMKSFPNIKRNAVVYNSTYDMITEYGKLNGVFDYTEDEISKNISKKQDISKDIKVRLHDEYINESIRKFLKPRIPEEIISIFLKKYEPITVFVLFLKKDYLDGIKYLIENYRIYNDDMSYWITSFLYNLSPNTIKYIFSNEDIKSKLPSIDVYILEKYLFNKHEDKIEPFEKFIIDKFGLTKTYIDGKYIKFIENNSDVLFIYDYNSQRLIMNNEKIYLILNEKYGIKHGAIYFLIQNIAKNYIDSEIDIIGCTSNEYMKK